MSFAFLLVPNGAARKETLPIGAAAHRLASLLTASEMKTHPGQSRVCELLLAADRKMVSPVGLPHKAFVDAGVVDEPTFNIILSVATYPPVMAAMSRTPTSLGGPGKGISSLRQPTPIRKPKQSPAMNLGMDESSKFAIQQRAQAERQPGARLRTKPAIRWCAIPRSPQDRWCRRLRG